MRRARKLGALITLSIAILTVEGHSEHLKYWSVFSSNSGYDLRYPSEWTLIDPRPDVLFISSSIKLVEAVIIPHGAQMILVHEIDPVADEDYVSRFTKGNPGDVITQSHFISIDGNPGSQCKKVFFLEDLDEVGPGAFYIEDRLYCKIKGRVFELILTQWKSDSYNWKSLTTLRKMASSLHI